MKYGKFLRDNHLRVWRRSYMDYSRLKAVIKETQFLPEVQLAHPERNPEEGFAYIHLPFFRLLRTELRKVSRFYVTKEEELTNLLQTSREHIRHLTKHKDLELKRGHLFPTMISLRELINEAEAMKTFVQHNINAFRKIVKKHDKATNLTTMEDFIQSYLVGSPFYISSRLDDLTSDAHSLLIELDHLCEQMKIESDAVVDACIQVIEAVVLDHASELKQAIDNIPAGRLEPDESGADGDSRVRAPSNEIGASIYQQAMTIESDPRAFALNRALFKACKAGFLKCTEVLLAAGANVTWTNELRNNAYHAVAAGGFLEVVQLLLAHKGGSQAALNACNWEGRTPLHIASEFGHPKTTKVLVEGGAGLNTVDNHSETPLMLACQHGHANVVKILLKQGASVSSALGEFSFTPLHLAALYGNADCASLLIAAGADKVARDVRGWRPLHWACKYGHLEVVSLFLSLNEPSVVSALSRDDRSCIHEAAGHGHARTLGVLLSKMAKWASKNAYGFSQHSMISLLNQQDVEGWTALHHAVYEGYKKCVLSLRSHGADQNICDHAGWNAHSYAVWRGHIPLASELQPQEEVPSEPLNVDTPRLTSGTPTTIDDSNDSDSDPDSVCNVNTGTSATLLNPAQSDDDDPRRRSQSEADASLFVQNGSPRPARSEGTGSSVGSPKAGSARGGGGGSNASTGGDSQAKRDCGGKCRVTFKVRAEIPDGHVVCVLGNVKQLGAWQLSHGLRLKRVPLFPAGVRDGNSPAKSPSPSPLVRSGSTALNRGSTVDKLPLEKQLFSVEVDIPCGLELSYRYIVWDQNGSLDSWESVRTKRVITQGEHDVFDDGTLGHSTARGPKNKPDKTISERHDLMQQGWLVSDYLLRITLGDIHRIPHNTLYEGDYMHYQQATQGLVMSDKKIQVRKIKVSTQMVRSVSHEIDFPILDGHTSITMQSMYLDPMLSLQFDLFDNSGKRVGRGSVFGHILRQEKRGRHTCAIVGNDMRIVGRLTFHFLLVTPFVHRGLKNVLQDTYWVGTIVIGHRGGGANTSAQFGRFHRSHFRENTLLALASASSLGAEFVEFDVQLTKDLVPIIHHDYVITARDGHGTHFQVPVDNLTLEEFVAIKDGKSRRPPPSALDKFRGGLSHGHRHRRSQSLDNLALAAKSEAVGEEGSYINDKTLTFKDALTKIDSETGFNVEIKYPLESEIKKMGLNPCERNRYLDVILATLFEYAGDRHIMLSSFDPDICQMLRLKQPRYPVFFLTDGGTENFSDPRRNSLQAAVHFAQQAHLVGIVTNVKPLIREPGMIRTIKEMGLLLASYGVENNNIAYFHMQKKLGVDAIIADHLKHIKTHQDASASPTKSIESGSSVQSK